MKYEPPFVIMSGAIETNDIQLERKRIQVQDRGVLDAERRSKRAR